MIYIDHPYHFDDAGSTALTTWGDHALDMIYQFLLTFPSERVNRPEFGTPLARACFEGNSEVLADVTEFVAKAGLQRWLGDVIDIVELTAAAEDAVLRLELQYRVRGEVIVRKAVRPFPLGGGGAS